MRWITLTTGLLAGCVGDFFFCGPQTRVLPDSNFRRIWKFAKRIFGDEVDMSGVILKSDGIKYGLQRDLMFRLHRVEIFIGIAGLAGEG